MGRAQPTSRDGGATPASSQIIFLEQRVAELEAKLDDIADKVELAADILDTVPLCDGCMQEDSDPCGCWISELKAMLNKEQGDE